MIVNHIKVYIAYKMIYYIMTDASASAENRILATLKQKPMSLSELSRKMKMRRDFLTGYLEAMRHEGKVTVVKVGKSKVYRPKKR